MVRENVKVVAVKWIALLRRIMLRLGESLVEQGIIKESNDIFFLYFQELENYYLKGASGDELTKKVEERISEYKIFEKLKPAPLYVGDLPFTFESEEELSGAGDFLKGLGASGGEVTGEACVIMNESEMPNFTPGKILIAPYMNPGWSPLISMAKAIVTDTGGVMSHGSIIAREFGIPCIVSVHGATAKIKTGDHLQINGAQGTVRIL